MTPQLGKHYSLPFPPATPSSPSQTLEGLFELTRRPLRAFKLALYVASSTAEVWTQVCPRDCVEVPRHCRKNWRKPCFWVCKKHTLIYWSLIDRIEIWVSDQTCFVDQPIPTGVPTHSPTTTTPNSCGQPTLLSFSSLVMISMALYVKYCWIGKSISHFLCKKG